MITLNTGHDDEYGRWVPNTWWANYFSSSAVEHYPINFTKLQTSLFKYNACLDHKQRIHFDSEQDYLLFMLKWS